jgi:hypothetical protein
MGWKAELAAMASQTAQPDICKWNVKLCKVHKDEAIMRRQWSFLNKCKEKA